MKLKRISTYITNSLILIVLFSVSVQAQNDSISNTFDDSNVIKHKYGLRVGVDLAKLTRSFIDDEYSGFEIAADYRIKEDLYIAAELGFDDKNTVNDYLDVTTKGSYIKAGIDYNMYDNWLDMDNLIFAGFRIGASTFSHNLNSYTIYNKFPYWQVLTSNDLREYKGLNAVWAELILGLKVEVLNNLFLGINAQLKFLATETNPENFENVFIPGFYKTYDSSGIGAGYSYYISYRIPLYKRADKPKGEDK
ncbi:DUF6048 family protein [Gaetbulibacter saemankumensis]|uniref:DUF6048 family protein n=1 Tax=Gaetbulibacter saemankumensis TaxID=311208 RepID=UPI00040E2D94|nr:DUF6048 family protein [Gaetbulibacter saemankumensis]